MAEKGRGMKMRRQSITFDREAPCPGRRRFGHAALSALAVAAATGVGAQGSANRLPLRNLVVEVRQATDSASELQRAGVSGGQVVIGSGGVSGQAGVEWRTARRDEAIGTTQQVLVLNGGVAGVRVAAQTPWQFYQVLMAPQGPVVVPGTAWVESATGFRVRPRWPGGAEPVTVELMAESGGPALAAPSVGGGLPPSAAQGTVLSTLQMPLGEWVTVARSRDDRRADVRGTLSSGSAEQRGERVLQMRVTAP
jgi:hypothetical protein